MRQVDGGDCVRLALFGMAVVSAFGAVDGTVNNATSGKPQANVPVTLIALGSGMQTLATVQSSADGRFHFDAKLEPATPYLVQSLHQGVTYNQLLPPGTPTTDVRVDVFDAAAKVPGVKVSQHMILLEPTKADVAVSETVIFDNAGTTTLVSPDGNFQFFAPVASGAPIRVTVQGPKGMPVQRPAEKGRDANTWVVKAPIKPGETRIDISYTLPAASAERLNGKILHDGGPVRIVVPKGVTLDGPAIRNAGTHPQTQATIYEVTGREYALAIQGTGTLREAAAQVQVPAAEGAESGPGIEQVRPLIYRRMPWILALGFSMLAVGFVLLYKLNERSASSR